MEWEWLFSPFMRGIGWPIFVVVVGSILVLTAERIEAAVAFCWRAFKSAVLWVLIFGTVGGTVVAVAWKIWTQPGIAFVSIVGLAFMLGAVFFIVMSTIDRRDYYRSH